MSNSFKYYSPTSVEETIEVLKKCNESTCVLAGGTDLIVKLKKHMIDPENIVNLKKVDELNYIEEKDGIVKIGAMTTHSQIEQSPLINGKAAILAEACRHVGSTQIRNLGTIRWKYYEFLSCCRFCSSTYSIRCQFYYDRAKWRENSEYGSTSRQEWKCYKR